MESGICWVGITGSWRVSAPDLEHDVRSDVMALIRCGKGLVSGGALGVDFIATDEALRRDATGQRITVILPTSLAVYRSHYRRRAAEGVITRGQAEALIAQLEEVKRRNTSSLIEMGATVCNEKTYYARNTNVVEFAHELLAYQVNDSLGTADTIAKARERGIPVVHRTYTV
jgi:hypothetical protein